MSKCEKCGVEILDKTERCPLCRHVLSQRKEGTDIYPDVRPTVRKLRFAENLVLFLSLFTAAFLIYINRTVDPGFAWSGIVCIALFYVNVVLRLTIIGKSGYMFKSVSLIAITVLVLWGIDYLTGYRKWSLNYIFPCGILFWDAGILVLMIANRRNWQSYMLAELAAVLVSLAAIAMYEAEILTAPIMAGIAFWVSVFQFLGTLILGDKRARSELYRRFYL